MLFFRKLKKTKALILPHFNFSVVHRKPNSCSEQSDSYKAVNTPQSPEQAYKFIKDGLYIDDSGNMQECRGYGKRFAYRNYLRLYTAIGGYATSTLRNHSIPIHPAEY